MTTKPLGIPRVIEFGFQDYREDPVNKNRSAECRKCGRTVKEKAGTTSNFLRHLRKHHPELYQVYQESKQMGFTNLLPKTTISPQTRKSTPRSSTSKKQTMPAKPATETKSVSHQGNTKEKALVESIVDLIVEDSLPLQIVESQGFNNFLKKVNPKYKPIGYESTRGEVIRRSAKIWADIWKRLSSSSSVNATVDVWSDGARRFFIAVTAHLIEESRDGDINISSLMLSCQRLVGRHAGEEIASAFARIVEDFAIERKLDYIIMTDASIMKKALTASFLPPDPDDAHIEFTLDHGECLDDDSIWVPLDERCDLALCTEIRDHARHTTLKSFPHTLHLCIDETLKKTDCIQYAVLKACRLATAARSSCSFTELFKVNGTDFNKLVPNTRKWNNALRNIEAIISCDHKKLSEVCPADVALDAEEFDLLRELVTMMQPFLEASDLTRNGINHTISVVVPTVLALYKHLLEFRVKAKYLHNMATDMADALYWRFKGVFGNVGMTGMESGGADNVFDFGEQIYIQAAVLDPTFGLQWLRDVHADEVAKNILRKRVLDDVLIESESRMCFDDSRRYHNSGCDGQPVRKAMKLFGHYKKKMVDESQHAIGTAQLKEYLKMVEKGCEGRTCFQFWSKYKNDFDLLYPLARRVLRIPASSAAVEHVFAEGGIMTKQRQSVLDDHTLSHLVFLKSNWDYQYCGDNGEK